jgi:uncharacterized protein
MRSEPQQVAALPIRPAYDGAAEILLVTTRDTGRWVVPKGWRKKDVADHEMAALEAFEEAGIRGKIAEEPIGRYRYYKEGPPSARRWLAVLAFPMFVEIELPHWPEELERRRAWFPIATAIDLVREPRLRVLIRRVGCWDRPSFGN